MTEECTYYSYKYIDLLVPPIDILNYLCEPYSKTYLFIISFFRIILLLVIAKIFYTITRIKGLTLIIFSTFLVYIIFNVAILFLIITKKTKS